MERAEKVEAYFEEEHRFKNEIGKLRDLVLKTELEETFKWRFPTYTIGDKNILALCRFKHHFGIWFFNGVFLSDPKNILENAQEGKTQAMRHWKFTSAREIDPQAILAYIHEAIENQKKGLRLVPKQKNTKKISVPIHLERELAKDATLKESYYGLSLSKQNEYSEYIGTAKLEKTKIARLKKILPMILEGAGLHDKYRK